MDDHVPRDPTPDPRPDRPELVEVVLREQGIWLMERCEAAAKRWPAILDAHDLFQGVMQRLLRSRTDPDAHATGVRTFLARCLTWVVREQVDARIHQGGALVPDEEVLRRADAAEPAPDPDEPLDEGLLRAIGLTDHQILALRREVERPELTWQQYADLVNRSCSAVRKDRERAVRRIEAWLGLDPLEHAALARYRVTRSIPEVARTLHRDEAECRALVAAALRKIRDRFHPREEG